MRNEIQASLSFVRDWKVQDKSLDDFIEHSDHLSGLSEAERKELDSCLESNGDTSLAHYWRGIVHTRQSMWDDALLEFQNAVSKGMPVFHTYYWLAQAQFAMESNCQARLYLEELQRAFPESRRVKEFLDKFPVTSSEEDRMVEEFLKIPGWFSEGEMRGLHRLAQTVPQGARILEIGSYRGRTTNVIGHAVRGKNAALYCLDVWEGYEKQGILGLDPRNNRQAPTDMDILNEFLTNTSWLSPSLRALRGSTEKFQDFLPASYFDLIFVDGAHDYANVTRDIQISLRCLKPGGILCGHDYQYLHPDVMRAVDELVFARPDCGFKGALEGTSLWYSRILKEMNTLFERKGDRL